MNAEDRSDEVCARAVAVMLEGNDVDEAVEILFPATFYVAKDAHCRGEVSRYDDDPVYQAALRLGTQIAKDDEDLLLRFVEISAEDAGIVEARTRGLNPTSLSTLIQEFQDSTSPTRSRHIQRRVTSQFEFELPSTPWMV